MNEKVRMVQIRFKFSQFKYLCGKAKKAGLSKSEFLRRMVLTDIVKDIRRRKVTNASALKPT